ncbi:MAG: GNAT family N-acetyltransferase [Bacillota bacterium]
MEVEGRIVELNSENMEDFTDFCRKHRGQVDDSYLYEEDLNSFEYSPENPTYLYMEGKKVIAAASLIIDEYNRRGNRARFRILYSEKNNSAIYDIIFHRILIHAIDLEKVYIFVPSSNIELMGRMEDLGFKAERFVYLMVRDDGPVPDEEIPEGYEISSVELEKDYEDWCKVRNEAFAFVTGNEIPICTEMILTYVDKDDYIPGGIMILRHNGKAVGTVRCIKDEYEGKPIVNIGSLSVIPEYQHKSLGGMLLREAIRFAEKAGYKRTVLSVNENNKGARRIYEKGGFVEVEGVVSYEYHINQ